MPSPGSLGPGHDGLVLRGPSLELGSSAGSLNSGSNVVDTDTDTQSP